MIKIRYAEKSDKLFWLSLDRHLSESGFEQKVRDKMGYILSEDETPTAILRYNFFWDLIPFCTLLYVDGACRGRGYGTALMDNWEREMKQSGHEMLMTSTQADESAQHFYRKIGFHDAGGLIINSGKFKQPTELFFIKEI